MQQDSPGRAGWESSEWNSITLEYDELATIGRIVLAWGSAESALGGALAKIHEIRGKEAIKSLILRLPFHRKVDLLSSALKEGLFHPFTMHCATELKGVFERYKANRDVIAHGFAIIDLDAASKGEPWKRGLKMPSHDRFLEVAELPKQLKAADYAAELGAALMMSLFFDRTDEGKAAMERAELMPKRPETI